MPELIQRNQAAGLGARVNRPRGPRESIAEEVAELVAEPKPFAPRRRPGERATPLLGLPHPGCGAEGEREVSRLVVDLPPIAGDAIARGASGQDGAPPLRAHPK